MVGLLNAKKSKPVGGKRSAKAGVSLAEKKDTRGVIARVKIPAHAGVIVRVAGKSNPEADPGLLDESIDADRRLTASLIHDHHLTADTNGDPLVEIANLIVIVARQVL